MASTTNISDIIDMIEDVIDNASSVPVIGKVMIDKDEILSLIQDLRLNIPEEIKEAKWIKEHNQKSIEDVRKRATEQANEIIEKAQQNAKNIRLGAISYADDVFAALENKLVNYAKSVHQNRAELRQ